MHEFEKLKALILEAEPEAQKFYEKGTKAAAMRLRVKCQEIKKQAQVLRLDVKPSNNK